MPVNLTPPDRPGGLPSGPISPANSEAPLAASGLAIAPPHLDRLSGQPPAQLGPASPNFLQQPSGMAARTIDPFLTVPDRVNVAQTSLRMRREMREGAGYKESVQFARARRALLRAERDFSRHMSRDARIITSASLAGPATDIMLAAHAQFEQTCISIVEARAARGIPQPLYPAFREASHLLTEWPTVTSTMLLDSEAVLVDAAGRSEWRLSHYARRLHNAIWALHDLEHTQPRNDDAVDDARDDIKQMLKERASSWLEAMTGDLRLPSDPLEPLVPKHVIAFVDHFADEPWTPGKKVEQSHTDSAGQTTTQVLPWPNPAEGITRLRFQFSPKRPGGCIYVHTFNVPYTNIGMEEID